MTEAEIHLTTSAAADVPRIFVGADENQVLPYKVLKYSIERTSRSSPAVISLANVETPDFADAKLASRTGFSFKRFAIPQMCEYSGRAIYLDADMQVFQPIEEVWNWPMEGRHLLHTGQSRAAFAVLLMDCAVLQWNIREICRDLERGRWNYDRLLYRFDLLEPEHKAAALPNSWNELDSYEVGRTRLIHYTDMTRQPWIYGHHRHGSLWYSALNEALGAGAISEAEIAEEINAGHVCPDLPTWLGRSIRGVRRSSRGWKPPYLRRLEQLHPGALAALRRQIVYSPLVLRLRDRISAAGG